MSVRMCKANCERLVPKEKVAEYLEMGYSALDDKGNVVKRPVANTVPGLKARVAELEAENAACKAHNEMLKARVAELEAVLSTFETIGGEDVAEAVEDAQNEAQTAKRGKNAKKAE